MDELTLYPGRVYAEMISGGEPVTCFRAEDRRPLTSKIARPEVGEARNVRPPAPDSDDITYIYIYIYIHMLYIYIYKHMYVYIYIYI